MTALVGLHWTDALDVLVIGALVYASLRWVRRSEGALVAVGIAIICAAWGVARALDLQMTTWAFQGVFALFAVVIAVLFQEELRCGLETVAAWALGRREDVRPRLDGPGILVSGLTELARRRIGALVLLPGLQPLRRHVNGGTQLDGELSEALLQSLFDPHSDGHDGALIVEGRRVTRFGVQLPLSRDLAKLGTRGTRHAAGLGLSERTDALCLVVSEERGAISVAHRGVLRELDGAEPLRREIQRFYKGTLPLARRRPSWSRWLLEYRLEKLSALGISLALWWVLVSGSEQLDVRFRVPIEFSNVPSEARVRAVEPSHVEAVLSGPRHALLWAAGRGVALQVDASDAHQGDNRFSLDEEDLLLPSGVSVETFDPVAVAVRLELPPVSGD